MKRMKVLLWFIEGIIVGFGAIMPGISGGTLCVAFKMYYPIMNILSSFSHFKKYGFMVFIFLLGGLTGFIGLSSLAAYLLEKNSQVMICLFIGFICGTLIDLYDEAGSQGRKKGSYLSLVLGFVIMMIVLISLKQSSVMTLKTDFIGYIVCGILWGLSFIIPGLSSSTLLLFFNIYTPMLKGISSFDFNVLIPLALGMIICVLLLSKIINLLYKYYYSYISHAILGIIIATLVMIIPFRYNSLLEFGLCLLAVFVGYIISYFLVSMTNRLKDHSSMVK